jgi:signal transduction histidine kinase
MQAPRPDSAHSWILPLIEGNMQRLAMSSDAERRDTRHDTRTPSAAISAFAGRRPRPSRFERVLDTAAYLQPDFDLVLRALLSKPALTLTGTRPLDSLWASEAINRAAAMLRLLELRQRRDSGGVSPLAVRADYTLALDLAELFQSLTLGDEQTLVPCSGVLRGIVADIDALFGVTAGDVAVRTRIERISLPACKRRALVLAASELVVNALLHAFRGRTGGRILVGLNALGPDRARLSVVDDGVGFPAGTRNVSIGVAADLANLLGATVSYCRTNGCTTAEIIFLTADAIVDAPAGLARLPR